MSWQTVYFHYDEDALTVTNAGLLRRAEKMLITKKVSITDANTGQFSSDGQRVVLHEAGIQQASCDCSAAGYLQTYFSRYFMVTSQQQFD